VGAPGAVRARRRVADRLWWPPGNVLFLQLAANDKRDGSAVGRPERPSVDFRVGERARLESVERPNPDLPPPFAVPRGEDNLSSVWRHFRRRRIAEAFGRRHREPDDRKRLRSTL